MRAAHPPLAAGGAGGAWGMARLVRDEQPKNTTPRASIHTLLDRLEKVRERGPGRWMACCPAHEDKSPSLSIRETSDGVILLKCFGPGCSAADIVAAVGLELRDLFPEKLSDHIPSRRDRNHFHAAREALKAIRVEVMIVAIAGETVHRGETLEPEDMDRLWRAVERIRAAAEVVL